MKIDLATSLETGDLGVLHLKRLWSRCIRERFGHVTTETTPLDWPLDNVIYHGLRLPIEETIQYLYQATPTFAEFEKWILDRNGGVLHKNDVERINATVSGMLSGVAVASDSSVEEVLSEEQIAFWDANGYLVISGLLPKADVERAQKAVWEHLEMDPDDPETWYQRKSDHGIMVQLFDHPALETIRRSPRVRSIFAQMWKSNALWISTDRVSFNPPERPGYKFPGPRLHWDVSVDPPIPFGVQGLIYLTDTAADQGAFTCVPGFHNRIESWLENLPQGADPRTEEMYSLGAKPIPGKAGDLVIWHQALPHGSSPNRASRPRIVEYVTMFPADAAYAENWR